MIFSVYNDSMIISRVVVIIAMVCNIWCNSFRPVVHIFHLLSFVSSKSDLCLTWWSYHDMGMLSALFALCDGNQTVTGRILPQTWASNAELWCSLYVSLNEALNKQSSGWQWDDSMLMCCHINSLGPSDAIWRHRSGKTLAQIIACCLTAPTHYLNQCCLIISEIQWQSPDDNFTNDTSAIKS